MTKQARERLALCTDENALAALPRPVRRRLAADISTVLSERTRLRWGFIAAMTINAGAWVAILFLAHWA